MIPQRTYVSVITAFSADGKMSPSHLIWEDGRTYQIDRVIDLRPAASQKSGGQGDRYTVLIHGKQRYLFFERSSAISGNTLGRWFIETDSRA